MYNIKIKYNYDKKADILYAHYGEPKPAKSIDKNNGIVLRIEPSTGKYIGFTIINYMARIRDGKIKKIPHFDNIELPIYQ